MSRSTWFRNTSWNAEIETQFFSKLARARDRSQYLRIQASTLADQDPKVALRLLDQYFHLGDHFDMAQAYVDRATAFLHLNQLDSAILAYESALAREEEFPQLQTRAWLDLPFLIARRRLVKHYERALGLLEKYKSRLMFPVDRFCWHGATALIKSALGDGPAAKQAARLALAASSETNSGLRYHRKVGLVAEIDGKLHQQLTELAR